MCQSLPLDLQRQLESVFGADLSDVRVHIGPEAPAAGACAFACGSHLFFAPGLYDPSSAAGLRLIGHELTHVLQQRSGRVGNPTESGLAIVHDAALEAEAERMGAHAAAVCHGLPAPGTWCPPGARQPWLGRVVQCAFGGALAGKTFEYFKREAGITFKEFGELSKPDMVYSSLEGVKEKVKAMRAAAPPKAPVVLAPVQPALSLPADWTDTPVTLLLYRAVDLTPGKLKNKGRFSPRANPKMALPNAIRQLLADPRSFAEGHVRANYDFVHSAAMDESCAGYQATRKYVYRISVPNMHRFDPPTSSSNITRPPIIWADTSDRTLSNATRIVFDPRKPTREVDLIFDIELSMIDRYKAKGTTNWVTIDWRTIQKEL